MRKKLQKRNEGFTIIEVMIVLAIAALILLIVLLAVPALQRNSRNTERKRDVTALLAALSTEVVNSNNQFPSTCWGGLANCFINDVNTSYYDNGSTRIVFVHQTNKPGGNTSTANADLVRIYNYRSCGTDGSGRAVAEPADSAKSVAAVYAIESANGTTRQCTED